MSRTPDERLSDILIAVDDAARIVERGRAAFDTDALLVRAAKNIVTEIGEAAKAIDDSTIADMPSIPWRAVKGIRDKVVHNCPEVDLDAVWATLTDALPMLGRAIRTYLGSA